jgi:exodeoxyribonuclease VII small subunit
MKPTTFRDAYATLQRHAQSLRNQSEPNIDDLLAIVNESVAAYGVCKKRIDAVEKALEEALSSAGLEARATKPAAVAHATPAADDDDVPF